MQGLVQGHSLALRVLKPFAASQVDEADLA